MPNQEILCPLKDLKDEIIKQFYKRTVMAISIIAIMYVIGLILFAILFVLNTYYYIFAILSPLFGYLWLITYGSKYVNNNYGLKKTSSGTLVFLRKRNSYTTYIWVHAIIFLISSIIRLIYEIHNLVLIKKELSKVG